MRVGGEEVAEIVQDDVSMPLTPRLSLGFGSAMEAEDGDTGGYGVRSWTRGVDGE